MNKKNKSLKICTMFYEIKKFYNKISYLKWSEKWSVASLKISLKINFLLQCHHSSNSFLSILPKIPNALSTN